MVAISDSEFSSADVFLLLARVKKSEDAGALIGAVPWYFGIFDLV